MLERLDDPDVAAAFAAGRGMSVGRRGELALAAFGREAASLDFTHVRAGSCRAAHHLGGSVASDIMWSLAHEQGIALPVKDYWEFDRLVTVSDPRGVANLDALDQIYHWTELIQSLAARGRAERARGDRRRVPLAGDHDLELRFNPMKRNRGGEQDLDHIILAAIRGLDRAGLEYPLVRAGLILMMDRTFTEEQNAIIVEKALHWASRGSSASTSRGRGRTAAVTTTGRSRRSSRSLGAAGSASRSTSARRAATSAARRSAT